MPNRTCQSDSPWGDNPFHCRSMVVPFYLRAFLLSSRWEPSARQEKLEYKLKLNQFRNEFPSLGRSSWLPGYRQFQKEVVLSETAGKSSSSNRVSRSCALQEHLHLASEEFTVSTAVKESNSVLHPSEQSFKTWRAPQHCRGDHWILNLTVHGARALLVFICFSLGFCVYFMPSSQTSPCTSGKCLVM